MKESATPFVLVVIILALYLIFRGLRYASMACSNKFATSDQVCPNEPSSRGGATKQATITHLAKKFATAMRDAFFGRSHSKEIFVRRIDGVSAIDAACGRSAEEGRPASFTTGLTSLGPVLYACLGILSHIAKLSARYKNRLLLPQTQPDVMAVTEEVVRDSISAENRFLGNDIAQFHYLSDEQFAFASGYIGLIQREKAGAAFLFGSFAAESLVLAEAGQQIGAMQIAGAISPEQVPFFIVSTDYTLIGEELFAASAYLTHEPVQLGSLYAQDRLKALFLWLIIIGVILATLNQLSGENIFDLPSFLKIQQR